MTTVTDHLRKMSAQPAQPVQYELVLSEHKIPLNPYLGHPLQLRFTGRIHCIQCGRQTKQSFQQGYCYPCMQRLAECQFCIIHPEKCQSIHRPCPPDDWAHAQCMQPHIVYLANSSGLKVGITRLSQTVTRWIDQGASQALPILQIANRYQSGVIEVYLKQFINDKTNWRKLVKEHAPPLDLLTARDQLLHPVEPKLAEMIASFPPGEAFLLTDHSVTHLNYPVHRYPQKAIALSLDETPSIHGVLQGIKGQYLLFDTGVINIRKFSGYEVVFSLMVLT